jgi:putative heme-binding domain-containing protein
LIADIVNPSAVVARQYQVTMVRTSDGRLLAGLVQDETPQALTLQTANDRVTLSKHDIESRSLRSESFMPTGLLATLKEHEVLDLLSFLMSANLTDVSLQSSGNRQRP